ncbi:MAG: hypothetical protein F4X19_15790 [Acidobacteria bacterium]|nr:hypothetical protein [Acidobacteriota bacterium]
MPTAAEDAAPGPEGTIPPTLNTGGEVESESRGPVTTKSSHFIDYDTDDDGLIEIDSLAQLDAVRHDLDGDGTSSTANETAYAAAFPDAADGMGCPTTGGCSGYELMADLDFDTDGSGRADTGDTYWNDGEGWVPIGGAGSIDNRNRGILPTRRNPFHATFDGNGHTIANLFISTENAPFIGLFGYSGYDSVADSYSIIRRVGMIGVELSGYDYIGGLVGWNEGEILSSYATGQVSGWNGLGGLVGMNRGSIVSSYATVRLLGQSGAGGAAGGLVGTNEKISGGSSGGLPDPRRGLLAGSYATGDVTGGNSVGGLAGWNEGTVTACYATGRVGGGVVISGLVGWNRGTITASYATGESHQFTSGQEDGLVNTNSGLIQDSYFDRDTTLWWVSRRFSSRAETTEQLQEPTGYTGLYENWNVDLDGDNSSDDPWDFGTTSQYPVLKADWDGSGGATWQEFGHQIREGPTLSASTVVRAGQTQVDLTWTRVNTGHWNPAPIVTYTLRGGGYPPIKPGNIAEGLDGLSYTDTVTPVNGPSPHYSYQVAAVVSGGEATHSAPRYVGADTEGPKVQGVRLSGGPVGTAYAEGEEIRVTVSFSETLVVAGEPQLTLELGGGQRTAIVKSRSELFSLNFHYTVMAGDMDTDGVSVSAGRIDLSGGTIEDEAGNPAMLDYPGVEPSLSRRVDGVKPVLLSASVNQALLALTYGEGLRSGSWNPDKDDFAVEAGGAERSVSSLTVNGGAVELTLGTAVGSGDRGTTVSYTPGSRPIQDLVGNQADELNDQPVTNTTGDSNTAPEVTDPAVFTTFENRTERWRLAATDSDDGDEVTGWEISGGADRNRFWIDEVTGDFGFSQAPDYETPLDQGSPAGDNEYVVMVRVTSGAGSRAMTAEREVQVSVQDVDEPPGKPEVSPVLEPAVDSLRVEWTEPDNRGSDITGYRVGYRKYGGNDFTEVQAGTGLSWTLTGLDDATLYEVRVQAINDEGAGPWSESVLGSTKASLTVEITSLEASPVEGPFTLRIAFSQAVTGFDSNDIEIQVETDCRDSGNNPLYCIPGRGTLRNHDFVRGISRQTFSLTLTPRTDDVAGNYTLGIRIAAGSALSYLGNQPNSEATLQMRVLTPGATAPEPISSLELEASAGTRLVMLSWNPPADNRGSAIVRYEYRYAAVGEGLGPWKSVGGEELGVTVGNLAGGREHVFEVRAVNGLGKGPIETVRATPLAGGGFGGGGGGGGGGLLFPPEAPTVLTALPGDEAVRLQWSPPESDGGSSIRRYEYRFKEGREEFAEWTPVPDSAPDEVNANGYTVGDLLNGTVYAFELRAVNAAGNGRVSEAVEVTMPLDPAYWSNFRAEDLEGVELMLEAFLLEGSSRDRELRFGEGLRFEEDELDGEGEVTATHVGSYGYRYTSRTTGEVGLDFDEGEACRLRLTFRGEGTGSYGYRCGGSSRGQGSFRMSELENRVPEITSAGPFEVEENRRGVWQLEAVDWDEEDEVTKYGIAGGVDGGLFAVEAKTGELSFKEAPDYENPGDVESTDPESGAGDNEYIVVIAVASGEGERERTGEQAIRVWVTDVEMEEAMEDEMEETESLFVPVILSSAGRNRSFFTSELTLTNRGEEEVELDYTYTATDEPETRSGQASDVVPAGRQRIATDALDYLRGLGVPIPQTGNQVGTLRVEAPPGSEVRAVVRTTTIAPDGRAGLAYPGVAEEEGFSEPVYLCGLRQNSRDRSNVAFQNMGAPGEGAITLRTTVYSGEASDTSARELEDITVEPGGFHQFSGLLGSVENGYVKVERVEGEAPFYAYGVINDQANSDGSFVFAVTGSSLEGRKRQTLPVIVETRDFTSELTVTNFSEEPRTLDFEFVSEQIQGDDKRVEFSMDLAAGEQAIVPELVEELRREEMAKLGSRRGFYLGALFVTAKEGDLSGVVIGARTSSEGGGGQYGVFYNAVPEGEGFAKEAWVEGLQQNEENRSNLALVNTGEVNDSPSVFHLEIYNGETGMLEETVVTKAIPARGWHQIDGILMRAGPETKQGYIRIEKMSGENPFLAYGVVNDGGAPGQRSGDGAYLPAGE